MTTLVVIGMITPEQARAAVEARFGGWTAAGPKPDTDLLPVPDNAPSATLVPDASRVQDEVILAETLGITRAHPDYYPLQVGRHVLAGGFYATRLYRDLREQAGLVYHVDARFKAGRTRSLFQADYACDPANVRQARALIERDLRQMASTPVSEAELRQAKTLLLRQIPLGEASLDAIARGLLDRAEHDLPLDEPMRAATRYLSITAEQVQAAFARWIQPERLAQIVIGPHPE